LSSIVWDVKCCPNDAYLTAAASQSGCVRGWDTRSDDSSSAAWQVDLGVGVTSMAWNVSCGQNVCVYVRVSMYLCILYLCTYLLIYLHVKFNCVVTVTNQIGRSTFTCSFEVLLIAVVTFVVCDTLI
jgi:WD40 repeat protein